MALCDVDAKYAAGCFRTISECQEVDGLSKMLDEQKDIDAVIVATPTIRIAVVAMAAMQRGKTRLRPEAADAYRW